MIGLALALMLAQMPDFLLVVGGGVTAGPVASKPYGVSGFAVKLNESTYTTSLTEFNLETIRGQALSSFRQGIERKLVDIGPLRVSTHAEAGVATSNVGAAGGIFAGGGTLALDTFHWSKRHVFVYGSWRILKSSLGEAQPVYGFGLLFSITRPKE